MQGIIQDYFNNLCCPPEIGLRNMLGTSISEYPVGVFNINGDYIGIANTQTEYITLWNGDIDNQTEGILEEGSTISTFKLPGSNLTEVVALRYYMWRSYSNANIYLGENDIVVYGSTLKKANVDGILDNTSSYKEWNFPLFGRGYKLEVPSDVIYKLTCSGYGTGQDLYVFHNDDSKYVGIDHNSGATHIEGVVPNDLIAFYSDGTNSVNYNLVTNWSTLPNFKYMLTHTSGGGIWTHDNPLYMPDANYSLIEQAVWGEFGNTMSVSQSKIIDSNFTNLKRLLITVNTQDALTGQEAYFLNIPKVTEYLHYRTQSGTIVSAATADAVWNNIATALTGVVPTGSIKEIRIQTTNSVTATSQASRDYLAAQGWTVLTA